MCQTPGLVLRENTWHRFVHPLLFTYRSVSLKTPLGKPICHRGSGVAGTARSVLHTEESIGIPCSVKA
jgi:hypothetical protein